MPVDEVEEEDESVMEDDQGMRKRRVKRKKKVVVQVYQDPNEKEIMMARAYGGVPRGAAKKVITKTVNVYRDVVTPVSATRGSKQINKVSSAIAGFQRDTGSRGRSPNHMMTSMRDLEEYKDAHTASLPGMGINESNEASMLAVPEHHIRE
jgi:hypothetical protein